MWRGVGVALRRFAPVGVCAVLCRSCSPIAPGSNFDSRYGVSRQPPRRRSRRTGAQGRRHLSGRFALCGRRPDLRPAENPHYAAVGLASWYGEDFHGRYTANGEIFDLNGISAAHPTMPMPSYARVTNLANGRSLIVRVNDRGPYCGQPHHRRVGAGGADCWIFTIAAPPGCASNMSGARRCRAPTTGSCEATLRENEPAPPTRTPSRLPIPRPRFPPAPPPPTALRASASGKVIVAAAPMPRRRHTPMSYADPDRASRCGRHRPVPQRPRALLSRHASF